MKKLALLGLLALLALPVSCAPATARPAVTERSAHHHARTFHRHRHVHHVRHAARGRTVGSRPHAWCGWYLANKLGIKGALNRTLWVAANWAHWGRAVAGPAPGVVGVMPHHVFIVDRVVGPGRVVATSGNDGGDVRTRERSTARVIAWRTAS